MPRKSARHIAGCPRLHRNPVLGQYLYLVDILQVRRLPRKLRKDPNRVYELGALELLSHISIVLPPERTKCHYPFGAPRISYCAQLHLSVSVAPRRLLIYLTTMNLYWVYNLPNWLFGVLTVAVTTAIGLAGLYVTRKWVRRVHGDRHSHNEVVGFYLSAVCVFYGITLGLIAVATWQAFSDVDTRVGEEAAAVGALYRDVSGFPDPDRTQLQTDLRQYARQVIDIAWPLARKSSTRKPAGGSTRSRNCVEDGCKACATVCLVHYGPPCWREPFSISQ